MKEAIIKFSAYWEFDKKYKVFSYILKSVTLIGFSVYLTFILTSYHDDKPILLRDVLLTSVLFIIWGIMEVMDIIKNKLFPIEILSHMNATYDLSVLSKSYHRKEKIDEYISESISSLNANTCPISGNSAENHLCKEDVTDSLSDVIYNLIYNTGIYLDCDCRDFTVCVLINNIFDPLWTEGKPYMLPISIVFRDDFEIRENFPSDIENFDNENPVKYFIQARIKQSIDQNKYLKEKQVFNSRELEYIFVPIPNVCEGCPPDGTIVIITKQKEQIPSDAEKVLKINGQIIANWLSKFNDCVEKDKKIAEHKLATMQKKAELITTNKISKN